MEENIQNQEASATPNATASDIRPSRWIGIVLIALFIYFGGFSHLPWYLWGDLILLAIITFAGVFKWGQLLFGVILLVWGTTAFSDSDSNSNESETYQTETTTASETKQTDSERRYIESEITRIENLKAQYERAERMGLPEYEQKRISDEAWSAYQRLQEQNLTHEQAVRLSNMFH